MTAVKDPEISRAIWGAYRELLREVIDGAHLRILVRGSTLASARAALQ